MIKILVVDDEAGVCRLIESTFIYSGFTVLTAKTAQAALKIVEKDKPKIVFLDILMPDMNGLELLKQIKKIDPRIIVFMVSVAADEKTRVSAQKLGADGFVSKPFEHEHLQELVMNKVLSQLNKRNDIPQPRILIVEDEKEIREGYVKCISRTFEAVIEEAASGQEALLKIKANKPDLMLLDIKLPGLSGMDVIGEIKRLDLDIKILVVSAWKNPEVVKQALEMGVVDYLEKPFLQEQLFKRLTAILMGMGRLILKKRNKKHRLQTTDRRL